MQSSVNSLATLFNGTVNLGLSQTGVNLWAGWLVLNEIIADPLRYGFDNVTGSACPAGVSSLACFLPHRALTPICAICLPMTVTPPQAQQMIGDYAVVATLAAPYYVMGAAGSGRIRQRRDVYHAGATPPPGAASPANRGHGQRLCPIRLPAVCRQGRRRTGMAAVSNTPIPWGWKPSCAPKRDWAWRWKLSARHAGQRRQQ